MWTTVAFVAALSLAGGRSDQLTLTNVRATYGILGATRPDNKLLPGDDAVVSFDIEGAKVGAGGKILYGIGMEVTDAAGKMWFKQAPNDLEAKAPADGKGLPACATVHVGLEQQPGDYTVKVTVTDRTTRMSQETTKTFQVLPRAFGLVRLTTTSDSDGQTPTAAFQKGQSGWINFTAVSFERDSATKQPNLAVSMRVLDEAGQPALSKPTTGTVSADVPAKASAVPLQFVLKLQQAGKYTVELTAADKVSGKEATLSFPLRVVQAK
jgi:hypothetical protein